MFGKLFSAIAFIGSAICGGMGEYYRRIDEEENGYRHDDRMEIDTYRPPRYDRRYRDYDDYGDYDYRRRYRERNEYYGSRRDMAREEVDIMEEIRRLNERLDDLQRRRNAYSLPYNPPADDEWERSGEAFLRNISNQPACQPQQVPMPIPNSPQPVFQPTFTQPNYQVPYINNPIQQPAMYQQPQLMYNPTPRYDIIPYGYGAPITYEPNFDNEPIPQGVFAQLPNPIDSAPPLPELTIGPREPPRQRQFPYSC